jgi:hypothetical protein
MHNVSRNLTLRRQHTVCQAHSVIINRHLSLIIIIVSQFFFSKLVTNKDKVQKGLS